jgi:hypothetical protein
MTFLGSEGNFGRHVYFAFGSNLNRNQMYERCPGAFPICTFRLEGWRLVFRGVADIVPADDAFVDGGLYSVSERDLRTLGRYEGVHHGRYQRIEIAVGVNECIFVYQMDSEDVYPPDDDYFMIVRQGYGDWNLPLTGLLAARRTASISVTNSRASCCLMNQPVKVQKRALRATRACKLEKNKLSLP